MTERKGLKALELWARRMTDGYPGVKVDNMTTSWRDGLAFCAILHHFRPDLIDFTKLKKEDIYHNNSLAFRVAERHLGIPALLDAEDMVTYDVPDRLSILTYLSQFYQVFVGTQGSPTRIVAKRPSSDLNLVSPASSSPPAKMPARSLPTSTGGLMRREPCAKCEYPVFLAEKLHVANRLYHRTCFRCARCNNQLSLANCYETETDGQYCCETCPDEEAVPTENTRELSNRSLSDEEKSRGLQKFEEDEYSANFESALEIPESPVSKARSDFLSAQILEDVPALPESEPPDISMVTDDDVELSEDPSSSGTTEKAIPVDETSESESNVELRHKTPIDEEVSNRPSSTPPERGVKPPILGRKPTVSLGVKPPISVGEDFLKDVKARLKPVPKLEPEETCEVEIEEASNGVLETFPEVTLRHDASVNSVNSSSDQHSTACQNDGTATKDHRTSLVKKRMMLFERKSQEETETDSAIEEGVRTDQPKDTKTVDSNTVDSEMLETDDSIIDLTNATHPEIIDISSTTDIESSVDKPIEISDSTADFSNVVDDRSELELSVDANPQKDNDNEELTVDSDVDYPDELNPFADEDDDDKGEPSRRLINIPEEDLKKLRVSVGGGDTSTGTEDGFKEPPKKTIPAPRVSLNPFWSDGEEPPDEESSAKPVPLPRKKGYLSTPEPKPRQTGAIGRDFHGSNTSLSSLSSNLSQTPRKKKHAPLPPGASPSSTPSGLDKTGDRGSFDGSPGQRISTTPRTRKMRKAPLPPVSSTPYSPEQSIVMENRSSYNSAEEITNTKYFTAASFNSVDTESEKINKDEKNRNRQSQTIPSPTSESSDIQSNLSVPDKSTFGKWKRKKGPAPSRPVPQRRQIKPLPIQELKHELDVIEMQQQGLEKQGVKLEQLIRDKCEGPNCDPNSTLPAEVEDMILELFELVNEKNELFRRQAELMYLKRQQRLEEEYADLEYQIRCLMDQPEKNKTDSDKAREEELINRLVEVVERRNDIIECLEMDRVREAEEDHSINAQLTLFTSKRDEDTLQPETPIKLSKKEKKKVKKDKKLKEKGKNLDIDKDIDESETSSLKTKEKKKKRWF